MPNARRNRHTTSEAARRLEQLKEQYETLERFAQALRPFPRFERVSRATIARWLDQAPRLPKRALQAIELLSDDRAARIRIAHPRSLWALPSAMLTWNSDVGRHKVSLARWHVSAEPITVDTPWQAIERLVDAEVDVAVADAGLVHSFGGEDCVRLCSLSRGEFVGFAVGNQIQSPAELKSLRCGIRRGSTVEDRIRTLVGDVGAIAKFNSSVECAKAVLDGDVDVVAGSEPFVSRVRRALGGLHALRSLPSNMLGPIETDVVINSRIVNPRAVHGYLMALSEAAQYAEETKHVTAFQLAVADYYDMDRRDVQDVLRNACFKVDRMEASVVFRLWSVDLARARATERDADH